MDDITTDGFNLTTGFNRDFGRKNILGISVEEELAKRSRDDRFFPPYLWQSDFRQFVNWRHCRRSLLNAFTGAGKSVAVLTVAYDWIGSDKRMKVLVCCPQNNIGQNFKCRVHLDGEDVPINPQRVGQDIKTDLGNPKQGVIKFLKRKVGRNTTFNDRICVMTHMTACEVFNELKDTGQLGLLKDVALVVDEAHHSFVEAEGCVLGVAHYRPNELANMIHWFVDHDKYVCLVTATFFRGDAELILKPEYAAKFTRYELPFDRYMDEVCRWLHQISIHYAFYKNGNYLPFLDMKFKADRWKTTIIHLAQVGSKSSMVKYYKNDYELYMMKCREVWDIMETIADGRPIECLENYLGYSGCTAYQIDFDGRKLIIVDLVEERGRQHIVRMLDKEKNRLEPAVNVIIALGVFKEGADYPPLERSFIIGRRDSVTEMIQLIGRPARDFPGKYSAEVYSLVPAASMAAFDLMENGTEELRDHINYTHQMFLLLMMMDEYLAPERVHVPNPPTGNGKAAVGGSNIAPDVWAVAGLTQESVPLREEMLSVMMDEADIDAVRKMSYADKKSHLCELASRHLQKRKKQLSKDVCDTLAANLWRQLIHLDGSTKNINYTQVEIDLIMETGTLNGVNCDPTLFAYRFYSGSVDSGTFKQLRDVCYKSMDHVEELKRFFEKNPGQKPNPGSPNITERHLATWYKLMALSKKQLEEYCRSIGVDPVKASEKGGRYRARGKISLNAGR